MKSSPVAGWSFSLSLDVNEADVASDPDAEGDKAHAEEAAFAASIPADCWKEPERQKSTQTIFKFSIQLPTLNCCVSVNFGDELLSEKPTHKKGLNFKKIVTKKQESNFEN